VSRCTLYRPDTSAACLSGSGVSFLIAIEWWWEKHFVAWIWPSRLGELYTTLAHKWCIATLSSTYLPSSGIHLHSYTRKYGCRQSTMVQHLNSCCIYTYTSMHVRIHTYTVSPSTYHDVTLQTNRQTSFFSATESLQCPCTIAIAPLMHSLKLDFQHRYLHCAGKLPEA
jgi:hypothetical protein